MRDGDRCYLYSRPAMPPIASVDVPASSANLGSGFDCFAAALSLKLRAELHVGNEPGILLNAHGEGAPRPDDDPEANLVIRAFREGMRASHGATSGSGAWRLEVSSMIPASRGLGSSAAAIVAGLLLGASVGRSAPPPDALLGLAAALEGHPDNISAALYGGFTLAVAGDGGQLSFRRFRVPEAWIPVVFLTAAESRTHQMRAALPAAVPHRDAASQAGRAALLATAILTSDAGMLREAMRDSLHQPYRLPLLPGSRELIELAYERGAAGACLSGAGPSILAICDSPISAHGVEKGWNAAGIAGMATRLRFDTAGARLTAAEAFTAHDSADAPDAPSQP
jgi:homoserine kinase